MKPKTILCCCLALAAVAAPALAQVAPPVLPPPPDPGAVTAADANWVAFTAAALVFFGKWVDPANANTPFNWSAKARSATLAVIACLVAAAHLFTVGSVAGKDALVAVTTILVPQVLHFLPEIWASRNEPPTGGVSSMGAAAAAGLLCLVLSGCSPQQGAQAASDVREVLQAAKEGCVLETLLDAYAEQVDPPAAAAIAAACQIDASLEPVVEQIVADFVATPAAQKQRALPRKRAALLDGRDPEGAYYAVGDYVLGLPVEAVPQP
jgi:hypothetical protein